MSFSDDSNMLVGGFADSYLRVWDLTGNGLYALKRQESIDPASITEQSLLSDFYDPDSKSSSKQLVGHSGPVYSTCFTPENNFVISGSQDGTARLWSLATFTNVAVYRGHNYPIWDVASSPLGYYFATASHDRTARLWSTDHIYPLRIFAGHLSDVDV